MKLKYIIGAWAMLFWLDGTKLHSCKYQSASWIYYCPTLRWWKYSFKMIKIHKVMLTVVLRDVTQKSLCEKSDEKEGKNSKENQNANNTVYKWNGLKLMSFWGVTHLTKVCIPPWKKSGYNPGSSTGHMLGWVNSGVSWSERNISWSSKKMYSPKSVLIK